jgi:hypothetical protein
MRNRDLNILCRHINYQNCEFVASQSGYYIGGPETVFENQGDPL